MLLNIECHARALFELQTFLRKSGYPCFLNHRQALCRSFDIIGVEEVDPVDGLMRIRYTVEYFTKGSEEVTCIDRGTQLGRMDQALSKALADYDPLRGLMVERWTFGELKTRGSLLVRTIRVYTVAFTGGV